MSLNTWLIFFLSYALVTYSPGPNVLEAVTHALRYGYRNIVVAIVANLTCQLLIITAVGVGAGALMTTGSPIYHALKWLGAAYLIYLGASTIWKIFTKPDSQIEVESAAEKSARTIPPMHSRFRRAFLVSASNPKTVIFLSAFLPQFVDPHRPLFPQFAIMFLTIAAIVASVHSTYAFIAVNLQKRITSSHAGRLVSAISGGVFIALGLMLGISAK